MTKYCAACNKQAEFDLQVQARRLWYEQWTQDIRVFNGEYCLEHFIKRVEEVLSELKNKDFTKQA